MIFKDISFASALDHVIYDDVLLQSCEAGLLDECFRLWESPEVCIVLGRVGKAEEELEIENIRRDHIPVFRRSSGGGTVVQGPGCLNFTFVLSKDRQPEIVDLHASYRVILQPIIDLLKSVGVDARFCPISDLAYSATERKFSGNAQRRARKFILHHGTLLCGMDLTLFERYLKIPASMPEYRHHRGHMEFVQNLPLDSHELRQLLITQSVFDSVEHQLASFEQDLLEKERLKNKWIVFGQ